jgi:hypothetical protein
LYAEILFPKSSGKAWVFHSKVTVKKPTFQGEGNTVWMPIPILLLNDFGELGNLQINLKDANGEIATVGKDNVVFPLASSKYYHKTGEITGFTPAIIKGYIQNSVSPQHQSVNLCNQGTDKVTKARIRLYFDEAAKQDIIDKIGAIP